MVRFYVLGCSLWLLAACDAVTPSNEDAGTRVPPARDQPEAGPAAGSKAPPPARPLDAGARGAGMRDAGAPSVPDAGPEDPVPLPQCPTGDCDLRDPLACGEEGDGCVLALADAGDVAVPRCSPVGTGGDGDACESSRDCSPGLDCTAFDGTGVCRRYCCALNRSAGCPAGQFCRVGLDIDMEASGVALCDLCDDCDPRAVDACGDGNACYPLSGSRACTACLPAGAAPLGASCTLTTECVSGSACFQIGNPDAGGGRCMAFCDLRGDDDVECGSGARCVEVSGAALPPDVGLCL